MARNLSPPGSPFPSLDLGINEIGCEPIHEMARVGPCDLRPGEVFFPSKEEYRQQIVRQRLDDARMT